MFGTKKEEGIFSLQVCWSFPVVPPITSLTRKLHISTAKGYSSVSAEAEWEGKEETPLFLNMCVAQLAKMALEKNEDKFPSLWSWVRGIAKSISLKIQKWNYKLNRICPGDFTMEILSCKC